MKNKLKITINGTSIERSFGKEVKIKKEDYNSEGFIPLDQLFRVDAKFKSESEEELKTLLQDNNYKVEELDCKHTYDFYSLYVTKLGNSLSNIHINKQNYIDVCGYGFNKINKMGIDIAFDICSSYSDYYGSDSTTVGYIYINKNKNGEYELVDYSIPNSMSLEIV